MKFSKALAGLGFLVLGSVAFNASAQASVCTWSSVYGYSSGGSSYTTYICKTSSNVVAASRTDTWTSGIGYSCGTPTVSNGFHNTQIRQGTFYPLLCNDIIVTAGTQTSSSSSTQSSVANACYTGASQTIQTSPGSYPAFNPSFCGPQPQCKYKVTSPDQHSYPRLTYTCL